MMLHHPALIVEEDTEDSSRQLLSLTVMVSGANRFFSNTREKASASSNSTLTRDARSLACFCCRHQDALSDRSATELCSIQADAFASSLSLHQRFPARLQVDRGVQVSTDLHRTAMIRIVSPQLTQLLCAAESAQAA